MNILDFLLRLNEEFDSIPKHQLPEAASSARKLGEMKMALSREETTAARFLSAKEYWIRAAQLAGIDINKIKGDVRSLDQTR